MIWPPLVPATRLSLYFVPNRSGAPAAAPLPLADAPGDSEPPAVEADGCALDPEDGDGVAAPPHAASTIIALPSSPRRRFCMNAPPLKCVSPHFRSQVPRSVARRPIVADDPGGQTTGQGRS